MFRIKKSGYTNSIHATGPREIMMKNGFFLTPLLVIIVAGCVTPANTSEKPIGKGYVNLCISDPAQADYWQKTDDVLWNTPENVLQRNARKAVTGFSSCDNFSVTIWEYSGTVLQNGVLSPFRPTMEDPMTGGCLPAT